MSLPSQIGTAAGILAAAGAAVSLWLGAERYTGPYRRAYRWFAAAAALWGAGVIAGQELAAPAGAAAIPLSFGDLPSLLALPVVAAGFARLAAAGSREAAAGRPPAGVGAPGNAATRLADAYILTSALFLIAWVTLFRMAFVRADTGVPTFAVELIHPLADLVLLGVCLPLAAAAGRRGAIPYLAVLAIAVGDALAVGARTAGLPPRAWALLVQAAGLALLACAPWTGAARDAAPAGGRWWDRLLRRARRAGRTARPSPAAPGVATAAAAAAAAAAALIIIGWALAGESVDRPVVAIVAGSTLLVLALRALGLLRRESSASWMWHESRQRFRELADRTSDAVLLCDLGGVIRYASRAVAAYGYTPEGLLGTPLADLLHPEDRSGGSRAVRRAVTGDANRVGRYPCRVRAADGTWRHVEATVSRFREPGGPAQLLVTARDVSTQVALRRQVTHLTFHDGLTGLPNRAYVEQRVREAAGPGRDSPGLPVIAGVILLDLDHFTAANAAVGHGAGDVLLAQVGRRVRAAVPPQDTVARWGGDEFAVLIEGTVSVEEIADMAERLARAVAGPAFRAGDADVSLTASVGVALCGGDQPEHLWRKADMAMSRAKERGGGQVEVFAGADGTDDPPGPGTPPGPAGPGAPGDSAGGPGRPGPPVDPAGTGKTAASPARTGMASGLTGQPQAAAR
ncbi:MAG TPA: sensor domain-containing diguanylate cyclase [Streptosporangiaceae bacterium]|nr:sensor domain-containing diguanylate cyclase [Streptosporangiaceae bacterium]